MTLLCGRYEGVDERLLDRRVDEEISIGDFVLSGGELAAMALIDAVVRQLPGALGDEASAVEESFADGLLDCPQYTRPEAYAGVKVPEVLMSGHHENIRRWRLKQALGRTWLQAARPAGGADAERRGAEAAGRIPAGTRESEDMNLIQTLEQEEIKRLKQDDPRLLARRHGDRQRQRGRGRAQALAGLRGHGDRQAQHAASTPRSSCARSPRARASSAPSRPTRR